jgi:hypothetical protein
LGFEDSLHIIFGLSILTIANICQQIEVSYEIVGSLMQIDSFRLIKELLQPPCSRVVLTDITVYINCLYFRFCALRLQRKLVRWQILVDFVLEVILKNKFGSLVQFFQKLVENQVLIVNDGKVI